MKKVISLMLALVMVLLAMPTVAFAALPDQVEPLWDNTRGFTVDLMFGGTSGTRGEVLVTITGDADVSNITASAKLYYKNSNGGWTELTFNWNYNVNQHILIISETFVATRGYEYKLDIVATLTKNGVAETISDTAIATCPPRT